MGFPGQRKKNRVGREGFPTPLIFPVQVAVPQINDFQPGIPVLGQSPRASMSIFVHQPGKAVAGSDSAARESS